MANAAAALAPELMPMMSGLASGLRSIVWNVTPPSPKQSPAAIASTARGRRSRPTVKEAPGHVLPEDHAEHVAGPVEGVARPSRVSTKTRSTAAASRPITARRRRPRRARPRATSEATLAMRACRPSRAAGVEVGPRPSRRRPSRGAVRRSQRPQLRAPDDPDEERSADQRRDDPHVDLGGPGDDAPDDVRGGEQHRAPDGRERQQPAVVDAGRAAGRRAARRARRSRSGR